MYSEPERKRPKENENGRIATSGRREAVNEPCSRSSRSNLFTFGVTPGGSGAGRGSESR